MNSDAVVYFADRYDSEKPTSVHSHNGTEIILVVHGECVNVLPGKEQHAKAGSVIVVPAGMSHRQLNSGRVTTVYVIFEAQQECFDCSARILDVKGDRYAPGWFEQIVSLKTARLDREADRLLGVRLSYLTGREIRLQREGGRSPAAARAMAYLEENYNRNISVAEVANACGVSPSHLHLLFRREFSESPLASLNRIRMNRARQLLLNCYLSIGEIGFQCGFNQPHYFCRAFRKIHGCTPGEYRVALNRDHDKKVLSGDVPR